MCILVGKHSKVHFFDLSLMTFHEAHVRMKKNDSDQSWYSEQREIQMP